MPNFITESIQKAKDLWEKTPVPRRMIAVGIAVLIVSVLITFVLWFNKEDMRILYSNLNPEDAGRIIKTLQADKIPYSLEAGGKTILVPVDKVYDTRIKIAGEGSIVGQGVGFEIFDDIKVGQTDFVQKINYMRALQGELARTINAFPSVESSRVHLVIPHRSLFIEEQLKPSASVVLKLKSGVKPPDNKETSAILNMLLMSVEGLDKSKVSISDSSGKVLYKPEEDSLMGMSSTQFDHRLRIQRNIERRIEEMLAPVFGPGRVISKVNVDLDYSQTTIRREVFDPEQSAVRSEQRSEETQEGRAGIEGGSPDVNFRGDGISSGSNSTQNSTRETRTTNYEINREEYNIVSNVGDIKRLTVAVIVDGTHEFVDDAWKFIPRTAEELKRVELLVANAVGINQTRGDLLHVSSIPFDTAIPERPPNVAELLAQYAERLSKPFLNALLAFLFLMLVVRPIMLALIKPKVETGEMIEGLEGLPAAEEQLALYEALEEAARADEEIEEDEFEDEVLVFKDIESLKSHIFSISVQHMEQVVTIVRGWMKNGTTEYTA